MELVPRLNAEEIRGLFAPPPWGIYLSHLLYVLFIEFMTFSWQPCFFLAKSMIAFRQTRIEFFHVRDLTKIIGFLFEQMIYYKCMEIKVVTFKIYIKSVGNFKVNWLWTSSDILLWFLSHFLTYSLFPSFYLVTDLSLCVC